MEKRGGRGALRGSGNCLNQANQRVKKMNIRFNKIVRRSLGCLMLGALLSGCNEYYERPDYGYDPGYRPPHGPGYDDVSDRRMIKNCKLRVENKISRKLNYAPRIDFGYADVSDKSRYQSRVKGEAYVRDKKDRLRVDYRCIVERDNGKVTDVKLDWRDKPGNGGNKGNAASACKSHISRKVQRDTSGQVSIDFRKHDSSGISGNRRRVTGNAHVSSRKGTGKIGYECVVDTSYMKVLNAHYRWTQKLPSGGSGGYDKKKAKSKCHKAIANKVRKDNYKSADFKSTSFRPVGNADLMVEGKVRISGHGQQHPARYECRVKGHNGNLVSARYWRDRK